jgi:hypothetical protein
MRKVLTTIGADTVEKITPPKIMDSHIISMWSKLFSCTKYKNTRNYYHQYIIHAL